MRIFLTMLTIVVSATFVYANECLIMYDHKEVPSNIKSLRGLNAQSQRQLTRAFFLVDYNGNAPVFYFRGGELEISSDGNTGVVFVANANPRKELENYAAKVGLDISYNDIYGRQITPQNELISARQFFMTMKTQEELNSFINWIATTQLAWNAKRSTL